jgi:hypothetical protein
VGAYDAHVAYQRERVRAWLGRVASQPGHVKIDG